MKKTILSIAFLIVTTMSCKKDDGTPDTCSNDVTTIAGSYKVTAIKYKINSTSPEQDFFAALPACEKDDIIILNTNGTANYQDAGTACTPNNSYSSTWALNGNSITIDGTPGNIQSFDCRTLVVSASGAFVPGDIFTVTYEKQ